VGWYAGAGRPYGVVFGEVCGLYVEDGVSYCPGLSPCSPMLEMAMPGFLAGSTSGLLGTGYLYPDGVVDPP
jgi:hypothetical protein